MIYKYNIYITKITYSVSTLNDQQKKTTKKQQLKTYIKNGHPGEGQPF